jgi:predicted glycosyltransferase
MGRVQPHLASTPLETVTGGAAGGRNRRFLLFSNEAVGLGHLRRTIAIAARLGRTDPAATSLIVTGSPVQALFELPPRVEAITLPTLARDRKGRHHARRLALGDGEVGRLRGTIARATALAFEPDCAVVDRFPLGLEGELAPALEALRASGCKLVLGLRDIEDDPAEVRRTWGPDLRNAIRNLYDLVLVYGPSSPPLDALDCLEWDADRLPVPVVHVGYVGGGTPAPGSSPDDLPEDYVLATVGGGADGFEVLAGFVEALRLEPLPCPAVVITGPLMPDEEVERLEELTRGLDVRVSRFRPNLDGLIARARAVVCMAGYNTVAEVMRARKPALLVPRVRPISEQLLRAQELGRQGLQDVLLPTELSPATMRAALDRLLARPSPPFDERQFRGTERTADLLAALAATNGHGVKEPSAA